MKIPQIDIKLEIIFKIWKIKNSTEFVDMLIESGPGYEPNQKLADLIDIELGDPPKFSRFKNGESSVNQCVLQAISDKLEILYDAFVDEDIRKFADEIFHVFGYKHKKWISQIIERASAFDINARSKYIPATKFGRNSDICRWKEINHSNVEIKIGEHRISHTGIVNTIKKYSKNLKQGSIDFTVGSSKKINVQVSTTKFLISATKTTT